MILPRGIAAPFALLVALATATLLFTSAVGNAPAAFLGDDGVLLLAPASGIPGIATVDASLVTPLRGLPSVDVVSPEIYVITTLQGRSLFVRGAQIESLLAIDGTQVVEGREPEHPLEALAGVDLLETFDLRVGDEVIIGSSHLRFGLPIRISGSLDASAATRDEIVLPLATARALADVPASDVHMIRIRASDPARVDALLHAEVPTFTYSEVTINAHDLLAGDNVTVRALVTNWGPFHGTKHVELKLDGTVAGSRWVDVPPRSTVPVSLSVLVEGAGERNVTLNPRFNVTVREPRFHIEVPPLVQAQRPFQVRVLDKDATPVSGIEITGPGVNATTDADGRATLEAPDMGKIRLYAVEQGTPQGLATVHVLAAPRSEGPPMADMRLMGITTDRAVISSNETFELHAEFLNHGDAAGFLPVTFVIDDVTQWVDQIPLSPGAPKTIHQTVGPLAAGTHTIGFAGLGSIEVRIFGGRDPALQAYIEAQAGETTRPPSFAAAGAADEYISEVIGDVRAVVIVLSLLSVALTTTGLCFVLVRHVAEAEPKLGIHRALGAPHTQVTAIVEREVAWLMAIGAAAGIGVGTLSALAIASVFDVRAFGHAIRIDVTPVALLLIFLCSIGISVIVARAILAYSLRAPIDQLLRGSSLRPLPAAPPALDDVLERA